MKKEILLKSKAIFTATGDEPFSGGILISGNQIAEVFHREELTPEQEEGREVYDLGDRLILPGFVDGHTHFSWGATAASSHMCTEIEKSASEEECVAMIRNFARQHPEEKRILGLGWFPANWKDAPLPTKASLDAEVGDRPVYLVSADAHSAWLNTKALQECGYTAESEVSFGEICKGDDGEPNGLLLELEAMAPVVTKMISFEKEVAREMYGNFLEEASRFGITSLSDMTAHELNEDVYHFFELMAEMEAQGTLSARLHIYSDLLRDNTLIKERHLAAKYASEKLRYSGLKQFIDGVTSTYTGFLIEPYEDKPETRGFSNYQKDVYQKAVIAANAAGFGVRLHCIGDQAVRWGLDIFEESNRANNNERNKKGLKNTIEHIEHIHPQELTRFKETGVIASMQPYHLTLDANEKIARIGRERCRYEWPFKSLLQKGAKLAFGTDFPVIGLNPFANIYAAITRRDDEGIATGANPEEKISLAQALRAYTAGSAEAYGRENDLGTLEKGKLADIAVTGKNLFTCTAEEIRDSRIHMTIFDGKIIYKAES